jgi:hypothetical protein
MNFVAIFWLLVAFSAAGVLWLLFSPSRMALVFVLLFSLAALVWAGFWNWILRDGLGSDSATSTGLEAWRRFGSDMLFPGSVCGLTIIVAVARFLLRDRRTHDVA